MHVAHHSEVVIGEKDVNRHRAHEFLKSVLVELPVEALNEDLVTVKLILGLLALLGCCPAQLGGRNGARDVKVLVLIDFLGGGLIL